MSLLSSFRNYLHLILNGREGAGALARAPAGVTPLSCWSRRWLSWRRGPSWPAPSHPLLQPEDWPAPETIPKMCREGWRCHWVWVCDVPHGCRGWPCRCRRAAGPGKRLLPRGSWGTAPRMGHPSGQRVANGGAHGCASEVLSRSGIKHLCCHVFIANVYASVSGDPV